MKKLLGFLALAALVGGTVIAVRDNADAMPLTASVKIQCAGHNPCCDGTSSNKFVYNVKLAAGVSTTSIDVGTHDGTLSDYTLLTAPTGWSLSIASLTPVDHLACVAHGTATTIDARCPYALHFSGPAQTSDFTLSYAFGPNWDHHVTNWKASTGDAANWSQPVGTGDGPIHSPWMP